MRQLSRAESLLQEFGVTQPEEIDLEAIAWAKGVRIRDRLLDNCEARIFAKNEKRAVISVDASQSSQRRIRFSIGHELGHWVLHQGQTLFCRSTDIGSNPNIQKAREQAANAFAADLLLPTYIVDPIARSHRNLTTKSIKEISDLFSTSKTATAIRLVNLNLWPSLLITHRKGAKRWKWFMRSRDVPERWFPTSEIHQDSYALDAMYGKPEQTSPRRMPADVWFDRRDAGRYELFEQTFRISDDEILTILSLDDAMLAE